MDSKKGVIKIEGSSQTSTASPFFFPPTLRLAFPVLYLPRQPACTTRLLDQYLPGSFVSTHRFQTIMDIT